MLVAKGLFDLFTFSFTPENLEPIFEYHGLSAKYYEDAFNCAAYANKSFSKLLSTIPDEATRRFLAKNVKNIEGNQSFSELLGAGEALFSGSTAFELVKEIYHNLDSNPGQKMVRPLRSLARVLECNVFPNIERKLRTRSKEKLSLLVAQTKHRVLGRLEFLSVEMRGAPRQELIEDVLNLLPYALMFCAFSELLNKHADDLTIMLLCTAVLTFKR